MRAHLFTLLIGPLLASCVSYEPALLVPALTLSPEQVELAPPRSEGALDFGVDVTVNESDSLFNVTVLPGVLVRAVSAGGPAANAGVAVGDVILSVDGMPVNQPDAIRVIERQQRTAGPFSFTVRRGTTVFEASVQPRVLSDRPPPTELYRADPIATRAGYRTRLVAVSGDNDLAAAEVTELFPQSPLPAAGIGIGTLVLALDGTPISSAQDLINRLNQPPRLGESVNLTLLEGDNIVERSVRLWDPGRRISSVHVGPLLRYDSSLAPRTRRFTLLDLWLFSLYDFRQENGERRHRLLGLFGFSSDYGELVEEP